MRDFKFRAWDKANNIMMDVSDFNCMKYPEMYEIMQYTGKKDINNKNIYEGDIVECKSVKYDPKGKKIQTTNISEVKYQTGAFQIKQGRFKGYKPFPASFVDGEYYKVIGNVFENPELIKNSTPLDN